MLIVTASSVKGEGLVSRLAHWLVLVLENSSKYVAEALSAEGSYWD